MGSLMVTFSGPIVKQWVDKQLVCFFGQRLHQPPLKFFLRWLMAQQFARRWQGGSGYSSGVYSHLSVSFLWSFPFLAR